MRWVAFLHEEGDLYIGAVADLMYFHYFDRSYNYLTDVEVVVYDN